MIYAKTPINYLTMREIVDAAYAAMADPAVGPWGVPLLKQMVLVAGQTGAPGRYIALLANALSVLTVEQRTWFMATYSVPGAVQDAMASPPAWPDVISVEDWPTPDPANLPAYIAHMDRLLVAHAEAQAARVTKQGNRVSMAYTQKYGEALAWNALTATKKTAAVPATDYPYLAEQAAADGTTVQAAADAIIAKGTAWNSVNAKIEGERERFQIAAGAAADMTAVRAAYDASAAAITALIDGLVTPA
jgi:hypothetical protein